ncbi:MAG: DUF4625 domain-containing protein [Bacteroidetes bacterium]|nr:DUF4625 domain-containing protein [Bacteroidota bacterium]
MRSTAVIILLIWLIAGCNKAEVDDQKPVIDFGFEGASPLPCDTLQLGDTLRLRVRMSDNVELGSFRVDIHHNFDHHSHSTEPISCELDPKKPATNPFAFIGVFDIPAGRREYEALVNIALPLQNQNGPLQGGDYHFFISLTDKTGWSSRSGFGLKLVQP